MRRVFIGHRGVGKSALLKRHEFYFPQIIHYDLDEEIEKEINQTIFEFFKKNGEEKFRELEKNVFRKLTQVKGYVVSVGAGFDISSIPDDCEVIYISRRTDHDGRIFFNRPRLNAELTPLEEYRKRLLSRDENFRTRADFVYHMPEGLQKDHAIATGIEKSILQPSLHSDFKTQHAFITLVPQKEGSLQYFNSIELRTDLFSDQEIKKIISVYPQKHFLISYRKKTTPLEHTNGQIDWALELDEPPNQLRTNQQLIVSNHDDAIQTAIEKFKKYSNFQQKLCPVITTWQELILGHYWQQADPLKRSFLPRSPIEAPRSLWRWYRELQFLKQKINFIQMFQDFDDQPSLFEYFKAEHFNLLNPHSFHVSNENLVKGFCAVLGDPVHHSWTPITQMEKIKKNVLAIPFQQADFSVAIEFLRQLGLVAAAVTSPLKSEAAQYAKSDLENLNTLVFAQDCIQSSSTDEEGFQKLVEIFATQNHLDLQNKNIVVWGGGGVLDSLKSYLPRASFYSARTASPRPGHSVIVAPDIVIWSAPRKQGVQWPPTHWKPSWIIDVNYAENSMGLEYAQRLNCNYTSGADMFFAQASAQAAFWRKFIK